SGGGSRVGWARGAGGSPRNVLPRAEPPGAPPPPLVPSIVEGLANIRAFGPAVFIAEPNIHHVPDFPDRLYVIERGEIMFVGKPEQARRNPAVARIIEGTAPAGTAGA